jgi:hypothetical protein
MNIINDDNIIYDGILSKLDEIKNNIIKIKDYNNKNNKNNNIKYIEKLNNTLSDINYLSGNIDDLYDLIIENIDNDKLDNIDKYKKLENIIYKKSYETFLPYILQMQIMLKNKL